MMWVSNILCGIISKFFLSCQYIQIVLKEVTSRNIVYKRNLDAEFYLVDTLKSRKKKIWNKHNSWFLTPTKTS